MLQQLIDTLILKPLGFRRVYRVVEVDPANKEDELADINADGDWRLTSQTSNTVVVFADENYSELRTLVELTFTAVRRAAA